MAKKIQIFIHGLTDISTFVQEATKADVDIIVSNGRTSVDGSSLMGMLALDTSKGFTVKYPDTAKKFEEYLLTLQ